LTVAVKDHGAQPGFPCFKAGQASFNSRTRIMLPVLHPDNRSVRFKASQPAANSPAMVPWALEIQAISAVEASHLVPALTGAILGCGGWVLTRSMSDSGRVTILFEFERRACVEIYTALIASGVELSRGGHLRMTELCQCTCNHLSECGAEIASIEIEIQISPLKVAGSPASSEGMSGEAR
jgi:hypothetical protein